MRRFLGLVPPEDFAARVTAWQRALGHHITAPHVTVKAPSGLADDLAWLPAAQNVCAAFPAFEVELSGVQTFDHRVIYLAVAGERVVDLHAALLQAVSPAVRAVHEGRGAFTPHLTLVLAWEPLAVGFDEAWGAACATFTRPFSFTAEFVRLFVKRRPGQPYEAERDLRLGQVPPSGKA